MTFVNDAWNPIDRAPATRLRVFRILAAIGFLLAIVFSVIYLVTSSQIASYFAITFLVVWVFGAFAIKRERRRMQNHWN